MNDSASNWLDPNLPPQIAELANKVLKEMDVKGLRVRYDSNLKHLNFTQDRRVVDVPIVLIEQKKWIDIRYLFRAILNSEPGAWNYSADGNDWSAHKSED